MNDILYFENIDIIFKLNYVYLHKNRKNKIDK